MITDPDQIKQVFTATPDVLHPGEGARILEPIVGNNSVILLDEGDHMSQRKLMLPAFHGERMERLTGLMDEVAEREVAALAARTEPVELHPRIQALTLEIILRAVFGLDPGERLDALRERLTTMLALGDKPISDAAAAAARARRPRRPGRGSSRLRAEIDELIFELIDERRAEDGRSRRRALDAARGASRGRLADVRRRSCATS